MNTRTPSARSHAPLFGALLLLAGPAVHAQSTATPPDAESTLKEGDEVVVLSPFVVSAEEDADRYQAKSTLAGTRVRTDLKDVASSIAVVTKQFMRDTGATNNQTLLQYTTNTEVGGIYGNFGGVGTTFVEGASEGNLVNPSMNTRVRGLDSADNTRDYFLTDIPWDSYNVDRVDLQRGPNSILFGIGSPAGIVNSSVNTAGAKNAGTIENRVGSHGSIRTSLDINRVVLDDELFVRLALLDDNTKYRQNPAFNRDRRLFAAARWDPRIFKGGNAHTTLRANFERGEVKANRPRILPPTDMITPFFLPEAQGGLNRTAIDGYYAWRAGIVPGDVGTVAIEGETMNYWLNQNYAGAGGGNGPRFFYDNLSSSLNGSPSPSTAYLALGNAPGGSGLLTAFGIGASGNIDRQIDGYPFAAVVGIGTFNQMTISANRFDPSLYPGAGSGFYKSTSITDPTIFDFHNNLIDGPNKKEWQGWSAANLSFEQTLFNNRIGLQLVYDHQSYNDGQQGNVSPFISVDVNANLASLPWAYEGAVAKYAGSGTPGTNPNAGRAYIGNRDSGTGSSSRSTRDSFRATLTGEVRAEDFVRRSSLSSILGRHVFTGLVSRDAYESESRGWLQYALDGAWDDTMGFGPGPNGSGSTALTNNSRGIASTIYLSDPLFDVTSASGLRLKPIRTVQAPAGFANIRYFDSHWRWPTDPAAPTYVDPAAVWTNPTVISGASQASTQSENPVNYVGWTQGSFRVLNADSGDIDSLYTRGAKRRLETRSEGLTWQGYLWDDTVVATLGWRRDTQSQRSGNATISPVSGAADMSYDLAPGEAEETGSSRSWGIVLHEPKAMRGKLPLGSSLSLFYSDGRNTRVQNRYGFDAMPLPNATGRTKDYGFVVNTLDDRLRLKVTWYETTVKNANLSSVLSSESTLGANAYTQWAHPAWGLGNVLQAIAGMAGDPAADGSAYNWNWAATAHPGEPIYNDVTSPEFLNDPETIREKAAITSYLAQLDQYFPQSWWDAYGIPVNVAEAKLGNYQNAIAGWDVSQGNWNIRSATGGTINGSAPVGTVDNQSKGVEFEVTGQLTKNWNVSANASKQTASQVALGSALTNFIGQLSEFYSSPAGDIRLWWGGDQGLRDYFEQSIGAAYRFQAQTNGKYVPEMSRWRANIVTNYAFDRGFLHGVNIGLGYRWQQGTILGYALNAAQDNLDVDRPFWGRSEEALDLWLGYERRLTDDIGWRIQLNLRNVGDDASLQPISVQPDGTPALYRIRDGMIWTLTNTLSF